MAWESQSKSRFIKPKKIGLTNLQGMLDIHTNNLVESWHSILKMTYLRGFRKQRTDMLVYRLLREVLPDLRLKISRILRGFERRKLNSAERKQLDRCNAISSDTANVFVKRCLASLGSDDDYVEIITVRSFQQDDTHYRITLNTSSSLSHCTCPYMTETNSVCKHMFLAERQLGYSICYATRDKGSVKANTFRDGVKDRLLS